MRENMKKSSRKVPPQREKPQTVVPHGSVAAWIFGFLSFPVLAIVNEMYTVPFPGAMAVLTLVLTIVGCGLSIAVIRVSLVLRIALLVLSALAWWIVNLGVFVIWCFHPS